MNLWKSLKKEHQDMLKSWAKVFLAATTALWMSGETDFDAIAKAGAAAVIPLIITWLDPNDYRFGKMKELAKPAKSVKSAASTKKSAPKQ